MKKWLRIILFCLLPVWGIPLAIGFMGFMITIVIWHTLTEIWDFVMSMWEMCGEITDKIVKDKIVKDKGV